MKTQLASVIFAAIGLLSMLLAGSADAADFRKGVDEDARPFYVLEGDIVSGDAEKLSKLISSDLYHLANSFGLLVNSSGGNVVEAIKIAELVERFWLPVEVAADGECSSACFFVYVAAPRRNAYGSVRIHAPYYDLTSVEPAKYAEYAQASRLVHESTRGFLLARSVPSDLVEKMLSLSSNRSYSLTVDDRLRIGLDSAFATEIGAQKCGGFRFDRMMTQEEIRRYRQCTNMVFLEARLFHVWGQDSPLAKVALGKLGRAFRERVIPSPNFSTGEKLDMQKDLADIVTTLPPAVWVESFDQYLNAKDL